MVHKRQNLPLQSWYTQDITLIRKLQAVEPTTAELRWNLLSGNMTTAVDDQITTCDSLQPRQRSVSPLTHRYKVKGEFQCMYTVLANYPR
jgi:hypothetical protein